MINNTPPPLPAWMSKLKTGLNEGTTQFGEGMDPNMRRAAENHKRQAPAANNAAVVYENLKMNEPDPISGYHKWKKDNKHSKVKNSSFPAQAPVLEEQNQPETPVEPSTTPAPVPKQPAKKKPKSTKKEAKNKRKLIDAFAEGLDILGIPNTPSDTQPAAQEAPVEPQTPSEPHLPPKKPSVTRGIKFLRTARSWAASEIVARFVKQISEGIRSLAETIDKRFVKVEGEINELRKKSLVVPPAPPPKVSGGISGMIGFSPGPPTTVQNPLQVQHDGVPVKSQVGRLNFLGSNIEVTPVTGKDMVEISVKGSGGPSGPESADNILPMTSLELMKWAKGSFSGVRVFISARGAMDSKTQVAEIVAMINNSEEVSFNIASVVGDDPGVEYSVDLNGDVVSLTATVNGNQPLDFMWEPLDTSYLYFPVVDPGQTIEFRTDPLASTASMWTETVATDTVNGSSRRGSLGVNINNGDIVWQEYALLGDELDVVFSAVSSGPNVITKATNNTLNPVSVMAGPAVFPSGEQPLISRWVASGGSASIAHVFRESFRGGWVAVSVFNLATKTSGKYFFTCVVSQDNPNWSIYDLTGAVGDSSVAVVVFGNMLEIIFTNNGTDPMSVVSQVVSVHQ